MLATASFSGTLAAVGATVALGAVVGSVSGEGVEGAGRGTQAPGKKATRNSVMKVMVLLFTSPSLLN